MWKIFRIIKNHAKNWRDFLIDCLFPIECLGCGKEKIWLCADCQNQIKFNETDQCPACHRLTYHGQFCIFCADKFQLNGVMVAADYHDNLIKKLIKNLKYNFIKDLGIILGDLQTEYLKNKITQLKKEKLDKSNQAIINFHLPQELFSDLNKIIIIPIPLHSRRQRWRGFNQAEIIAKQLSQNLNIAIDTKNLVRIKYRIPQVKLKKKAREKNMIGCFAWQGEKISQKIILIDDLSTTASTLNEAAKVLRQHGAPEVWGLVVARN